MPTEIIFIIVKVIEVRRINKISSRGDAAGVKMTSKASPPPTVSDCVS